MLRVLVNAVSIAFACFCVATTTLQVVGLGALYSGGGLTPVKMTRYAAVLYGLDLSEIPMSDTEDPSAVGELQTREEIVEDRVAQSKLLADRAAAVQQGSGEVRQLFSRVRQAGDRFEQMKGTFDDDLRKQEEQALENAIREVERTLAVLPPRQSKELILMMLEDKDIDPSDDVLGDLVTIMKSLPQSKLKKIFGEFKTQEELLSLHELMKAIGGIELE